MSEDHSKTFHDDGSGSARERFVADLQTLSTHAQELLEVTNAISGEGVAAAREQLQESLRVAGHHFKRLQAEAMTQGRKVAEQTDSYVHEKPWQAIAIGMLAGLAIGLASGSAMRSAGAHA